MVRFVCNSPENSSADNEVADWLISLGERGCKDVWWTAIGAGYECSCSPQELEKEKRIYYGDPEDWDDLDNNGRPEIGDELCDGHILHYCWNGIGWE